MRLLRRLIVIVAVGLPVGYYWNRVSEPSRADAMIALFETHCLPLRDGELVRPPSRFERVFIPGDPAWSDPSTGLTVSFGQHRCEVSDTLSFLTADEVADVERLAREAVPRLVPSPVTLEASEDVFPLFLLWSTLPPADPEYWAITLVRFYGDHPATGLSLGTKGVLVSEAQAARLAD